MAFVKEQDKLKAEKMLKTLLKRQKEQAIRYWRPHPGQEKFLREVAKSPLICISAAGNGWGKSECLIALFALVMFPDLSPKDEVPVLSEGILGAWPEDWPKRARIYSTPNELAETGTLQAAIRRLFPKGRYQATKQGKGYHCQFLTDTGWTLDLFSYEQDPEQAAGASISLQGFNEPPPEMLWREAIARSRSGGVIVGAMTSLLTNAWVVDGIFNRADGKKITVVFGDVTENTFLDKEQVEKILEQYDPEEREARKTGRPLSFAGRIYKDFDREVHVCSKKVPDGAEIIHVVDPAISKPMAQLWAFRAPGTNRLHIFAEQPDHKMQGSRDSNLGVKDYAKLIRQQEGDKPADTRILDRHFGNARRTMGGKTLKQEFAEAGLYFMDSYSVASSVEVETGILKVKDCLRYDKDRPLDNFNQPLLTIDPGCKNVIASFERWSRNQKTGRPQEEFKDHADVVRYLCMADTEPEPAKDWNYKPGAYYGV